MKKWFLILFSLLLLAGCQSNDSTETSGKKEKRTETIKVMLDWYPNAVHSYIYAAKENGYFEEEGLNVEVMFPTNPTDPLTLSASGEIDLGMSYQPDVIMARAKNVPVKSVAAIVRSPLNYMMYKADKPINSPKDLKGMKIGYPGIPLNEAIMKTMVEKDGISMKDIKMFDVGFELAPSIVADQVDAVIGTFINHEYPVLKHQGQNIKYINPTEYGVPDYYELVLVAGDQTYEKKQKQIDAFMRAAKKGFKFVKENPDKVLDILFKHQDQANFPLIREVEEESIRILLPKMESEMNEFGSQDAAKWQEVMDWLYKEKLIQEKPEVEELFIK